MCPTPLGSNLLSLNGDPDGLFFWVSCWATKAETVLGQPCEGLREVIIFSKSLIGVSACHCGPVLPWACGDGPVMGSHPVMGLGEAEQVFIWVPLTPHTVVSL